MQTLGEAIRSIRTRCGLSQRQVAEQAGISQGQLSRLERNVSKHIRPQSLVRLASALGISPTALLPEVPSWRGRAMVPEGGAVRIGLWESISAASTILARVEGSSRIHFFSRVVDHPHGTIIDPPAQLDPRSRALSPRELVRALRVGFFDAIVAPRWVVTEGGSGLAEWAVAAASASPTRIAVFTRDEPNGDSIEELFRGRRGHAYYLCDAGLLEDAYRIEAMLGDRVEIHPVPFEKWSTGIDLERIGSDIVIVMAVEPYLSAWRSRLARTFPCVASPPLMRELASSGPPSFLSIVRRGPIESAPSLDRTLIDLVEQLRGSAEQIRKAEPTAIGRLAEALSLDLPTVLAELRLCEFTPQLATGWITPP